MSLACNDVQATSRQVDKRVTDALYVINAPASLNQKFKAIATINMNSCIESSTLVYDYFGFYNRLTLK